MESYKIRRAEARDIDALKLIEVQSGLSPWTISAYDAELTRPDAIILTALDVDEHVVGFILGRSPRDGSGQAEIFNIGILALHRRNGIGRELLRNFLEECMERGVKSVWLEVREGNVSAISFYESQGFVNRGTRPNFYSNPTEDAKLMCLKVA